MFTLIFVSLFLGAWITCGTLVWLIASVATRGEAGLMTLLLAAVTAPVGGLAVPLLIRDDGVGLWLSMAAAIILSALIVWSRVFARRMPARDRTSSVEDIEVGS